MTGTRTRTYDSPHRQAQQEETRRRIVEAFIEQLADPGTTDLSPSAAARAAGLSVRTVHHHFPDADAQHAAVAEALEARMFPVPVVLPTTPAELVEMVREVYRAAEDHLPLLRALVRSRVGTDVRRRRRAARLQAIQDVVAGVGSGEQEYGDAVAVISLLASADAGVTLADQYGLTLADAGRACAAATRAVLADLGADLSPAARSMDHSRR